MTAAHVTLGGEPVSTVRLVLPDRGVWWADVELELAPALSGRVALRIGDREWSGTVDAQRSGTHMERGRARLVGGAGGWGTLLDAKHYHSDAGVSARLVIEDAARGAAETVSIETAVGQRSLGIDYVRTAGPASRALADALRAARATWWVDAEGVTQVAAARPIVEADPSTYEVLEANPAERTVTLACDDVAAVGVGSRLTTRLDTPVTVRELEVRVDVSAVRLIARGSPPSDGASALLRSLVENVTNEHVWGIWRYRVTQRSGDRLELQAVRRDAGLPDVLPISMWPGVAGSHAQVALGAEVLVEFIEGDRTMPVVRAFAGKDGVGHVPDEHTLSVTNTLRLGGADATSFAAKADAVLDRLSAIVETYNAHTHPDPVSGNTGAPSAPMAAPASVAASKARVS